MTEVPSGPRDSHLLHLSLVEATELWNRRYPHAVSDRVLSESIELLQRVLEEDPGEEIAAEVHSPASLLMVRKSLLDLVRGCYVRAIASGAVHAGGADPDPDSPIGEGYAHDLACEPELLLNRLTRFEEVRSALEPEWDEQVEAGLSGPRAHELLAEIGHDLRSPLTSILFLSEVLKGSDGIREDAQQGRQLGLIYSGALTMLNIVNNFMELIRRGEAPSDPDPTVFSLSELMESTRRTVQPMADEKGLALEVTLKPLGSERRIGHPVSLSRILLNLTTNALKFTEWGEVEVRAEEIVRGTIEFSVTDTGPGIDATRQDAIFNVFDPAQDRAGIRFSGSGLGLVIVRRLLRSMGGELDCSSEVGEGTRMSFRTELPEP